MPAMLTIGERFDRYTIEALLGAGGMGEVYRAFDPRLERRVALKVLHQDPAGDDLAASSGHAARLLREARAAAALDHPNVVAIFDVGEVGDTTFLAMELIAGQSLRDLIAADVPLATRLVWLAEIAATLAFAHDRGLVHRDIKPENIMVRSDGALKVLDFGIARRTRVAATAATMPFHPANLARLTSDGSTIAGTPHYMAPEQMQGGALDGRADQFAWGVVAYELLTGGTMPWPHATDLVTLVAAVTGKDAVPLPAIPGLPAHVHAVVMRTLQRSPGARFPAMHDVVAALGHDERPAHRPSAGLRPAPRVPDVFAETLTGLPEAATTATVTATVTEADAVVEPVPASTAAPPRRRTWLYASAFAAVLALGGLGVVLLGGDDPPAVAAADSPATGRRTIAVIGFRNLSGREDVAWIATALAEMLTTELAIGEQLRTVAVDDIERMKRELALGATDSLGQTELASVGRRLRTDLVVTGNYLAIGEKVRLDVRLIDISTGEPLLSLSESDRESELIDLVSRTGASLRRSLHAAELSPEQASDLRASVPATPEGARLYATGLASLRAFDATRARAAFDQLVALEPEFALGHLALADALTLLGLGEAATAAAERAMALSGPLPRAERLVIEVRYHVSKDAWDQAIAVATTLRDLYPDDVDHGLRLARVQIDAGRMRDAVATVAALRRLLAPLRDDPRLDLMEADAYSLLGEPAGTERAAAEALRKAEALGATTIAVRARMLQAWPLIDAGELDRAAAILEQVRAQTTALGDPLLRLDSLYMLSFVTRQRDQQTPSMALLDEVVREGRRLGNPRLANDVLINTVSIQIDIGRLDEAEQRLAELTATSPANRLTALINTGQIAALRGDLTGARASFDEALRQYRTVGDERMVAWSLALIAELELDADRLDAAELLLRESLQMRERMGLAQYVAECRTLLGRLALARGRADEAATTLTAAADAFAALHAHREETVARAWAARALHSAGRDGAPQLARARELARTGESLGPRLQVVLAAAIVDTSAEATRRALTDALTEATRAGFVALALELRVAAARVELAAGRKTEALAALAALADEAANAGQGRIAREARALTGPAAP